MPNNTTNLQLYKKNPATDGNDTFDIVTMLNNNWDAIDTQLGAQIAISPGATPLNLGNGLQVITASKDAPLNALNIKGRTLVNLLGRDGNVESLTPWGVSFGTVALDAANKAYGNNGLKVTISSGSQAVAYRTGVNCVIGANYIVVADVKNGNATNGLVNVQNVGNGNAVTGTTAFGVTYMKFTATAATHQVQLIVNGAVGQNATFDGMRVYQVSAAEYAAIDSMSAAQIAAKYPYVDDVKHVNAPYVIRYGENLLPPLSDWTLATNNAQVVEPYRHTQSAASTGAWTQVQIPVIANTDYYIGFSSSGGRVGIWQTDLSTVISGYSSSSRTFNTGNNTAIVVLIGGDAAGIGSVWDFRLNIGATDKGFKPRNDDYIMFPNHKLASNFDGSVYDQIFRRDGKYWRENRFVRDMVLDGNLNWSFVGGVAGYKLVSAIGVSAGAASYNSLSVVKYDGKIVQSLSSLNGPDQTYFTTASSLKDMIITISSADSGWGDSYNPTNAEVQAYFNGWRMYVGDGTGNFNPYNGTGTKWWAYRDGNGSYLGATSGTAPTTPAPVNKGWQPYKLTYQLATPTFEEIQYEGGISLNEGLNQIEVGQGVIVREKAIPQVNNVGTNYTINTAPGTADAITALKNRVSRFVAVYKNGRIDSNWTLNNTYSPYGNYRAVVPVSNYDPTATYEVSYIALDQYLLSPTVQTVTGEYASNLKTVVDKVVQNQADIDTRLSTAENLARQLYQTPRQTVQNMNIYVDATNGADNNDGSAAYPFKTIGRAILSLPQVVNHLVYIYIADGTYSEDIVCSGFSGLGELRLIGNVNAITNVKANSYTAMRNTCYVNFSYIQMLSTRPGGSESVWAYGNTNIVLSFVTSTVANTYGINIMRCFGTINNCVLSNKTGAGLLVQNANIVSQDNSGSGNVAGVSAQLGSFVGLNGTQPSGTTPFTTFGGGAIVPAGGVIGPWGDNTYFNRSFARFASNANQTFSAGVATKAAFQSIVDNNLSEYDNVNYRFTAKNSGMYEVFGTLLFTGMTANSTNINLASYRNGSIYFTNQNFVANAATLTVPFVDRVFLNAGQYYELYVTSFNTTATLVTASRIQIQQIA